jgi:hypothetical protein
MVPGAARKTFARQSTQCLQGCPEVNDLESRMEVGCTDALTIFFVNYTLNQSVSSTCGQYSISLVFSYHETPFDILMYKGVTRTGRAPYRIGTPYYSEYIDSGDRQLDGILSSLDKTVYSVFGEDPLVIYPCEHIHVRYSWSSSCVCGKDGCNESGMGYTNLTCDEHIIKGRGRMLMSFTPDRWREAPSPVYPVVSCRPDCSCGSHIIPCYTTGGPCVEMKDGGSTGSHTVHGMLKQGR